MEIEHLDLPFLAETLTMMLMILSKNVEDHDYFLKGRFYNNRMQLSLSNEGLVI